MTLSPEEVEAALHEARRQLASGDGLFAQSVCLDVLAVSPGHVEAVVVLVEAIAESWGTLAVGAGRPEAYLAQVEDPAEKARLQGILAYRRALSMLGETVPHFVVRDWLMRARAHFEAAGSERLDVRLRLRAVQRLLDENPELS